MNGNFQKRSLRVFCHFCASSAYNGSFRNARFTIYYNNITQRTYFSDHSASGTPTTSSILTHSKQMKAALLVVTLLLISSSVRAQDSGALVASWAGTTQGGGTYKLPTISGGACFLDGPTSPYVSVNYTFSAAGILAHHHSHPLFSFSNRISFIYVLILY